MQDPLEETPQFLPGVGPKRAALLAKLGLATIRDVLYFAPRDYLRCAQAPRIADLQIDETAAVTGEVRRIASRRLRGGKHLTEIFVGDESGVLRAAWFNQPYRADAVQVGQRVMVSGKVSFYQGYQMVSPVIEALADDEEPDDAAAPGLRPVYPSTEGLSQWALRKIVAAALERHLADEEEPLPDALRARRGLPALADALRSVHQPETLAQAEAGRRRLAYDEFLVMEMAMALRRRGLKEERPGIAFKIGPNVDAHVRRLFPFKLTPAQDRAIAEIAADMRAPKPMNRLLQGDVGSGKTVVALYAMLAAIANGRQAALMAPTEILAEQHYMTIREFLANSDVRVGLFTGSASAAQRRENRRALAAGEIQLAVGTHALIQPEVEFQRLGLVVVDEQHKFGVLQRATLRRKGETPDVLVMTATPIPRTLSLTVFGDLDVSIIDEMPPGRQPIETRLTPAGRRADAWEVVREHVAAGRQAFVVYPLVEESEKVDLQNATDAAERLQQEVFPEFQVGLIHGRMKPEDKDAIMRAFRDRAFDVLAATTVIEVGIDIPNATVMVIEHANRYGLAQLHQLRGRIGRGEHPSVCILVYDGGGEEARERLKVMARTTDGFEIAEADLRLRGPGEFFGTRQHGLPELKFGDIINDFNLLQAARADAFDLVRRDPELAAPEHQALRRFFLRRLRGRLELIHVA